MSTTDEHYRTRVSRTHQDFMAGLLAEFQASLVDVDGAKRCPECKSPQGPEQRYCEPCAKRREEAEARTHRRKTRRRVCDDLGLPKMSYAHLNHPEWPKVIDPRFLEFAKTWDPNRSYVLLGRTGDGKTSAIVAALRRWALGRADAALAKDAEADPRLPSVCFTTAFDIALARDTQPFGREVSELHQRVRRSRICVIDDLGQENTARHYDILMSLANARHRDELPTVWTSGLTQQEITQRYSDAFWRRMSSDDAVVVDCHQPIEMNRTGDMK